MSLARKEMRSKLLNEIIRKTAEGCSSVDILENLLSEFIQRQRKKHPRNYFLGSKQMPQEIQIAGQCLIWLRKEGMNFIQHLNHAYVESYTYNVTLSAEVREILGAFFSIYEFERFKLHPDLAEKIPHLDVWDMRIKQSLWAVFQFKENKMHSVRSVLEKLNPHANWIPLDLREKLSYEFYVYLRDANVNTSEQNLSAVINSIVQFKNWIMESEKEHIMSELMNCFLSDREIVNIAGCKAIVALQEWGIPTSLFEELRKELYAGTATIQPINVLIAIRWLAPVLPQYLHEENLHEEIFDFIMLNIAHNKSKAYAYETLKYAAEIIPHKNYETVADCLLLEMKGTEIERIYAYHAWGFLRSITVQEKYLRVTESFLNIIKNKKEPNNIRYSALISLGTLSDILSRDCSNALITLIMQIIPDLEETTSLRYAAIKAAPIIYKNTNFVDNEKMRAYFFLCMEMLTDGHFREKPGFAMLAHALINQLGEFKYWTFAKENKKYLLSLLSLYGVEGFHPRGLIRAVYNLINQAGNILQGDPALKKIINEYIFNLKMMPLRIRALGRLALLNKVIDAEQCDKLITILLKLPYDDEPEFNQAVYETVDAYKDRMSIEQKIQVLCLLSYQPKNNYAAYGLMSSIYSEYRNELTRTALEEHVLSDHIPHIMSFSY